MAVEDVVPEHERGLSTRYEAFADEERLSQPAWMWLLLVGEADPPVGSVSQETVKQREIDGYVELERYGGVPEIGDEIEIMEGPMKGLRGVFRKELTDKERVVILLSYVSYQGQLIIEKKKLKKIKT